MRSKKWARLAIVAIATAGALVVGGTTAVADPPPGWGPGPDSVEFTDAWLLWSHHGRYADAPGNWHTGFVSVDESDDGITGGLYDWKCPRGVKPLPADNPFPSPCKLLRVRGMDSIRDVFPTEEAEFDHARNRLTIHHDISMFDSTDTPIGTVRIDVTMQGLGRPDTVTDIANGFLNYRETFRNVAAWGTVDGHRIHGHTTRRDLLQISFSAESWERTS